MTGAGEQGRVEGEGGEGALPFDNGWVEWLPLITLSVVSAGGILYFELCKMIVDLLRLARTSVRLGTPCAASRLSSARYSTMEFKYKVGRINDLISDRAEIRTANFKMPFLLRFCP